YDLVYDPSGYIAVTGFVHNGQWHMEDIFTVKLNAETGETHWLSEIDEPTWNYIGSDYGRCIDLDPLTGDVFVGGMMLIPASSSSVGQYCMIRLGDDIVNIPENSFNYSDLIYNYPNPFKDLTTITFVLGTDCFFKLEIFDNYGKKIRNLINERQTAGKHSVVWDGTNDSGNQVSSGLYFYKINQDDKHTGFKKMILIK
ncbi:MAG: T9SS type A sorting domain-containing protein, partial [Bacteroidales bacterium]|nr:T9SS type A sorting domain-containing protein [Bacteroidales bacterium]